MTGFFEGTRENILCIFRALLTKLFSLKFIYSEKATKFREIFTVDFSYVVKSTVEISQNFVNFSEYSNFKKLNANLFSELLEGNGDGNVLFVPNEYSDTENDYANEIGEDSLNEQAKEKAFEDYYDQLLKNVV